ncbi:hypothetical protein ACQSSU_20285 [Micromonospora echinospora]
MPFGIVRHFRLTFTLPGEQSLTISPAPLDQVNDIKDKLADPNAVIAWSHAGTEYNLPVRSILFTQTTSYADTSNATVELYQDASGHLYLRDPEQLVAHLVPAPQDDRPGEFAADAYSLIDGDWSLNDIDQTRNVCLDGLTLIATYQSRHDTVEPVWTASDDKQPAAGAWGQAYIGKKYLPS